MQKSFENIWKKKTQNLLKVRKIIFSELNIYTSWGKYNPSDEEQRKELARHFSAHVSVEESVSDVTSEQTSRRRRRATSMRSSRSEDSKMSKRKSKKREEPIELIKKEAEGKGNVSFM